jgi:amino-acid N-acetyltransferase
MSKLIRTLSTPNGRVLVSPATAPASGATEGERRRRHHGAGRESATGHLRKGRMADASQIQDLVTLFADRDEMLHRSMSEIQENIRDYFVIEEPDGRIVGCAALHVDLAHLAEIKSLAVAEERQGHGYGKQLVLGCVTEGQELGLQTLFALTYKPGFFEKLDFRVVDKATLPHKVWNECIRCPKFPDCGEIAVVRDL